MRPRRSTVVVFVTVAVAWLVLSIGVPWVGATTYVEHEVLWKQTPETIKDLWAICAAVAVIQFEIVAQATRALHGHWLMIPAMHLLNALLCTTLSTAAFVVALRWRERRAASRES